jgi:transposase
MAQVQTPIHIELTEAERAELERIARAESLPHRAVVRARVVLGLVDGRSVSAIAREVGRQRRIVRKWADRFVRKRLRGLDDAPRSGRPARFSPSRRHALGEAGVRAA